MAPTPWTSAETEVVRVYYRRDRATCYRLLAHRERRNVRRKAYDLGLTRESAPPDPNAYSSRFSRLQLDALDAVGGAYTDGRIAFGRATELRDLIRAGDVRGALAELEAAGGR